MAISLANIVKGKENKPPRILIYGTDGVGKSTFAACAPKPIFTQTEDRLSHIACDKFPLAESFQEAMENIKVLATEKHDYKTHVTDSVDWLEALIHKEICKKYGETSINANNKGSELSFGRGYTLALDYFRRYLSALEILRNEKKMVIILIAHAQIKRFEDPQVDSYDQYRPALHDKAAGVIQQWVDCVFFANYKVAVKQTDGGFGKKEGKGIGKGERCLYTEERPAFEAKNSYDLTPQIPLSWEAFGNEYSNWLTKK